SKEWRKWVLDQQADCDAHVKKCLDFGINFFDTANIYSSGVSEIMTGRAIRKLVKREEVIIATKVGLPIPTDPSQKGLSRSQILKHIDQSLKNLETDYIDLYQIHRWDYQTPIEETMETLHELVVSGKVRYIGASSMYAWQFCKANAVADLNGWTRFVSMQNHYNIIYREEEREMNPYCASENISLLPWSPLARGIVNGTRTREGAKTIRTKVDAYGAKLYNREADFKVADAVMQVAKNKGVSGAEVALAWLHQNPLMASPIFGATQIWHIEEAAKSVNINLTPDEIEKIEMPYEVNIVKPWNL
ncbi:MAG: aldo/keto reductase, partial [Saprospiraceae bacterium]